MIPTKPAHHNMRSDWPLVKAITKLYGPRLGSQWQRLPLIQIPNTDGTALTKIHEAVHTAVPDKWRLPFDDFILDMWFDIEGYGRAERGGGAIHTWTRVSAGGAYQRVLNAMSPWNLATDPDGWRRWKEKLSLSDGLRLTAAPDHPVVLESWSQYPDGQYMGPVTWYLEGESPSGAIHVRPMSPCALVLGIEAERGDALARQLRDDLFDCDVSAAVHIVCYLTLCPEWLVEVRSDAAPARRAGKAKNPKPWTNQHLPKIILLDPSQAPSGDSHAGLGGTHSSPRPHQRRANWHTLKHPKFQRNADGSVKRIFVKPAWIGAREWVAQGNRYRVIETTE